MAWASAPWEGRLPFSHGFLPRGLPDSPTVLQVMAALSQIDRGGVYGVVDSDGIYGRTGLTQDEAFVWWDLKAFTNGWLAGTANAEAKEFFAAIKAEHERVAALPAGDPP